MKRILVTGGAGFIGSHIVEVLLDAGHQVAVLDNLSTGKRENLSQKVAFYEADITDKEAIKKVFRDFKPEIVDHHAAQISVNRSVREPDFDAYQNIIGSINLLEASAQHGVERFIFASTGGALYGDAPRIPSSEDTLVLPLAPYGIAKASVEHYIRFFSTEHKIDTVVLRYANVYGPRQDPHGEAGVVAIFSLKTMAGENLTVYGNGKQTRDFVFVKDVARANLAAVDAKPGVFNVGTGEETSVNDLVKAFQTINPNLEAQYLEARSGEVFRSALDASKAAKVLGWKPIVRLIDGIKETYNWFANK